MRNRLIILVLALVGLAVLAAGCAGTSNDGGSSAQKQRQQAIQQRTQEFAKAQSQVPTPNITNFPRRKTLADAVVRQSLPNHPWYVYILGQNGNIVNYFVAKSVPVNDCDYLSATQNVVSAGDNGNNGAAGIAVLDSPSLEGIFQSQTGCNTLTFFDLSTDAEIQVSSTQSFVTDRPLRVQAQPIRVTGK